MQMTMYEEDEDGVTVHFDRGQPSVRAKVLIGADGYFSRVRKQCLNDGPPMFAVSASPPRRTPLAAPLTPFLHPSLIPPTLCQKRSIAFT